MLSVYEILKDLISWAWGHKRTAAEIGLMLSLLIVGWRGDRARAKLASEKQVAEGLAAGLAQQITIRDNQIDILKRDSNGKIIYKKVYVPPEGYVVVSEKERSAMQGKLNDLAQKLKDALAKGDGRAADAIRKEIDKVGSDTIYEIHDHGFVHRLGGRADYANGRGLGLGLDMKWYFWKRFGLVFGGTPNGIGPGLSYHLDQIPYIHPQNLELYFSYGILMNNPNHPIAGGLRFDF